MRDEPRRKLLALARPSISRFTRGVLRLRRFAFVRSMIDSKWESQSWARIMRW
jgi:hypothetical protein